MLTGQLAFACSCIPVPDPCDYLINEYSSPVLVHIDKMESGQIAEVTINDLSINNIEFKENYVILADSRTSCSISINHLKEGENYLFGFPLFHLDNDTINYYQCMSPFYSLGEYPLVAGCISKSAFGKLVLYPNPVQDNIVMIQNRLLDPVRLSVYNTSGKLIFEQENLEEYHNEIELPDDLANGIYFVRVQSGTADIIYSSKIVIAR